TVVLLQKTRTTPDYSRSLLCAETSVDSSVDSFFPVLPAAADLVLLVRKYFRRRTGLKDFESLFQGVLATHVISPGPRSREKIAPAPVTPRAAAVPPGGSSFPSP